MAPGRVDSSTQLLGSGNVHTEVRSRSKWVKVYFFVFAVIFFVLLLDSVVSLGSFGVLQKKVHDHTYGQCILFGHNAGKKDDVVHYRLSPIGACAFALWAQVSIVLIAFIWFVYSVVMIAFGPPVISLMRILDFLVMFCSSLLSFSLGVTLSAGLTATCDVAGSRDSCSRHRIVISEHVKVAYYKPLHDAESSSWVATTMLICLTIWNFVLVIVYCKRKQKQRMEARLARYEECANESSSDASSVSSAEELCDVTSSQKKPSANPFSKT